MKDMVQKHEPSTRNRVGRPRKNPRPIEREPAEEILFQAGHLFAQQGYEATTTREIAARAGLEQRSIFYYFPTKEDILAELAERMTRGALGSLDVVVRADARPAAKLYRVVWNGVAFRFAQPFDVLSELVPVMMRTPRGHNPRFAQLFEDLSRHFRQMHALFREGVAAGDFLDAHESLALAALYGVMSWPSIVARRDASLPSQVYSGLDQDVAEGVLMIQPRGEGPNAVSPELAAHELSRFALRALVVRTDELDDIAAEAMTLSTNP